jgi:hypothetical protein
MLTQHLAKHLRDVHTGGNWTWSNLNDQLKDINWQQAIQKNNTNNSIAQLVFHINYFVQAALCVFEGKPLTANDKYSFDCPPILSEADWEQLKNTSFQNVELLASYIVKMPEEQLWQTFVDEKYGNYYRNIQGIIEHTHYHLGQIAIIKSYMLK